MYSKGDTCYFFNNLAEEYFKEKGKYEYTMKIPVAERADTYIRFMNEDEEKGLGLRERYLFHKICQTAIDFAIQRKRKGMS